MKEGCIHAHACGIFSYILRPSLPIKDTYRKEIPPKIKIQHGAPNPHTYSKPKGVGIQGGVVCSQS